MKQLQLSIKMFFFRPPPNIWCVLKKNKPALIICFQRESWKQQTHRTLALPLYLILSSFVCFSCVHQRDFSPPPVCRDQRSPAGRKRKDKHALFGPHCVQSAETGVKYQNDPKVEEVLHRQHSILVLHDPLQVDFTSLIWSSSYKCIISDPVFLSRGTFYRRWCRETLTLWSEHGKKKIKK